MVKLEHNLCPRTTQAAVVQPLSGSMESWRLQIPPGPAGIYRLAQMDDYSVLPRRSLPWTPPLRMQLQARVSAGDLPGTWGFGFWNDPFSLSIGLGGMSRRFPALPEAVWYFHASPPNYLSFQDDLPAQGLLAATFASTRLPTWLLAIGALGLPLVLLPSLGRLLRRFVRRYVRQDSTQFILDPILWHAYDLYWSEEEVVFSVDGERMYSTPVIPGNPLGLVLWIDNQYAAWSPDGRMRVGFLPCDNPAWLEIREFSLE